MNVDSIRLKNFRGYNYLSIDFKNGINVFTGLNGSGKSNLLEAIYYLSFAKSFRGVDDLNLIQNNKEYAVINAKLSNNERKIDLDLMITQKGKKILINDKPVNKISNLSQICNVMVFSPIDVDIFRGSPKNRRQYLDVNISKINQKYYELLLKANNLLKERNEILKQTNVDFTQLEIITDQLIEIEKEITTYRDKFIKNLNNAINKTIKEIKGDNDIVDIVYFPFLKVDENYHENAKKIYQENLEIDLKNKATQKGFHREDFVLYLNYKNIAINGSQGENRLLAIALKLSPYFLVEDNSNKPIIALDDVLSELDVNHQDRLFQFLTKFNQVFITTTKINRKNITIYQINNHQIIRRITV